MQKKNIRISLIVGLLLVIFVFYIYKDLYNKNENSIENNLATTTAVQVEQTDDLIKVGVEEGNKVVIKEIKEEKIPIPDLNREIVFSDNYPEEARQIMIDKIEKKSLELKEDPTFFSNWLYLGIDRKAIEDYDGAKLVWEYAKLLDLNNFVVRGNLGDLYAYYLKDNQNAEINYLEALKLGPTQTYLYYKIAEFYTEFLNDKEKAIEIVEAGIKINSNSPELKNLLSSLK